MFVPATKHSKMTQKICPLSNYSKSIHSKNSHKPKNLNKSYGIAGKTIFQVQRRNERERRRVQAVNRGYEVLAQQLADWDELKNKKLTKAQTLKAAIMYIEHMEKLLHSSPSTSSSLSDSTASDIPTNKPPYSDYNDMKYCSSLPSASTQSSTDFLQNSPVNENFSSLMSSNHSTDSDSFIMENTMKSYEFKSETTFEHHTSLQSSLPSSRIEREVMKNLNDYSFIDNNNLQYQQQQHHQQQQLTSTKPIITEKLNYTPYLPMGESPILSNNNSLRYCCSNPSVYRQQQLCPQQISPYFNSLHYQQNLTRNYNSV